ncbi:hypothetical protein V8G54_035940 [Vigna mungo]|uniref:Uncharacterized protein n=1 Tax=Vigna mungo TaxID=3915 RepID=A0AAQ3MGD1_VIGMU
MHDRRFSFEENSKPILRLLSQKTSSPSSTSQTATPDATSRSLRHHQKRRQRPPSQSPKTPPKRPSRQTSTVTPRDAFSPPLTRSIALNVVHKSPSLSRPNPLRITRDSPPLSFALANGEIPFFFDFGEATAIFSFLAWQ